MLRAIVLNAQDNVAVLLAAGAPADVCSLEGAQEGTLRLLMAIPYGHKVAIRSIENGGTVVKYGEVIGRTTVAVNIGEYIHVHNVESLRGRGDKIGKGL
jgi:altronate dehydratase small subunit